jgi:uncharacterized RDD family membrane protein YckC
VTPAQPIRELPASFGRRFVAQLVDAVLFAAIFFAIAPLLRPGVVASVIPLIVGAVYYSLCEGWAEQTLGKRLLAIKVVDELTGKRVGPPRALLRYVVSWVSLIVLLAGYLWMLGNDAGQTWHDQIAHSLVVSS